ncbi:TolC family protein [Sulfurimonas sp. CVO]|uniref:TolC family protein n=1 Tax=Sulfurimonas sp. CVO TaxID=2283483 RepID=UPI00132EE932|nr:TolC family protein [Sulfurimonas sp. CVO]QHG91618.1 TolC family protein [Sulfurimonas sp. CVO]
MRLFISILCLPIFLYAYTLDELIELSHKNRVVESASHLLISKEKAYESTKSSYLPNIEVGATYQNVYEETAMLAENSLKIQASLKYTIYDGGKKESLYSQLKSDIDSSKLNIQAIKNTLSLDISRLYFEYLSLNSDKEATNQEIKQLEAEHARLQLFYETGSVTKDELDKIDSRLKNANVLLYEIELESQKILHALEYYTTQKIDIINEGSSVKLIDEEEKFLRADIQVLQRDAVSVMYEAKSKKSENLPSIYFDNTLSYSDYYFDNKMLESDYLVDTQNIAMLNISWNIFDFGTTTKNYESKFEEYLSKKSTFEYEKHKADVEYRLAKKSLEISKLKVDAAKATFDAAASTYELVKFKYQNGTIDNVAYLEALSEKYDAKRGYERAVWDMEIKKAEVIYYSGKDIKEFL